MIKKITYLLGFSLIVLFYSCDDFLDKEVDTVLTEDEIFSNVHTAPGFLFNIYNNLLPGYNRYDGAMLAAGCDEAENSYSGSLVQLFNNGGVNSSINPDDVWFHYYKGIRKTNLFLEKLNTTIAETNSIPEADRPRMKGEAIFFRAFFHFELVKRYRSIPYVEEVLTEETAFSVPQLSFDEVVEKIIADCDTAFKYLPETNTQDELGRVFNAAPMALKSRLLLYAASPLNNPENEMAKWERAAKAAKELLDMKGASVSLESKYEYVFENPYSREVLLATQPVNSNSFESDNYPVGYGGLGLTNPTQNLVDAFGTKYGKPISSDSKYDPAAPYENRDARFYINILHNDAVFKGRKVETFVGGKDGLLSGPTATRTGYYINKYIDASVDLDEGTTVRKPWVIFRFAEAYLNYAESMNEIYGPIDSVYDAVYDMRKRNFVLTSWAKLPNGLSQSQMRERIKNERQVEFAFEEQRFWDLRRWKDAEDVLNTPISGMEIIYNESDSTFSYQKFEVESRRFDDSFYWYPIPRTEVLKGYVQQNPGWE